MACRYTSSSYKGDALQLFLHHPLEVVSEVAVYQKYIECSLMICHKNIRRVLVDIFATAYLGAYEKQYTEATCPKHGRIESPPITVAYGRTGYRHKCGKDSEYHQNRYCNTPLIKKIYIAHDKETDAEHYKEGLDECLEHCLSMLDEAKGREGEGTKQDLSKLGSSFEESLEFVEARADELEEHYSKLLQDKFSKLSGDKPDQAVFMTELAAILVRYSINEEVSRLKVHLKEYWKLLSSSEPVGKKLDFLCQEMQRECNTIASKSQLVEINLAVVNMKDNIEDIREQVRNIE